MTLVSIIIPVYNVEQYLAQCLDSIVQQTYREIEIILVDDGSTDGSSRICDEYALIDSRIRVIHKQNGGLSSARNAGLNLAKGEYIAFVDSDDWVEKEMYEYMLTASLEYNLDVVTCGIFYHINNKALSSTSDTGKIRFLNNKTFSEQITKPNYNVRFEVWNKLFKREVISNARFKLGQVYEDVYFNRILLPRIRTAAVIERSFYNYRVNRQGATNSIFKMSRLGVFNELHLFYNDLIKSKYFCAARRMKEFALDMSMQFYVSLNNQPSLCNENDRQVAFKVNKEAYTSFFQMSFFNKPKHILYRYMPELYFVLWQKFNQ